jgi:hypothetical protein
MAAIPQPSRTTASGWAGGASRAGTSGVHWIAQFVSFHARMGY